MAVASTVAFFHQECVGKINGMGHIFFLIFSCVISNTFLHNSTFVFHDTCVPHLLPSADLFVCL